MKNTIGLLFCLLSVVLLAASDGLINMSASSVIGATDESRLSAKLVAPGVTIALLALGSIVVIIKDDLGKLFTWCAILFATLFSFTLSVQGMSIDYAVNDNSSKSSSYIRESNDILIGQLEDDKETNQQYIDKCERDRYFPDKCHRAIADNKRITKEIRALLQKSNESAIAETVDITEAVETKSGISGRLIESIGIYSRAIAVPIMITICMMGFWFFWDALLKDLSSKKPRATDSKSGAIGSKSSKTLLNSVNSSKNSDSSSSSSTKKSSGSIKKPKGEHVKNRVRATKEAEKYLASNGKYPASRKLQELATVGPKVACDVLRELKKSA